MAITCSSKSLFIQISGKIILLDGDKAIQTHQIQKADWCAIFKNGKVPSNIFWKILTTGFGKFLKEYMKCPIKNRVKFDRVSADSRMMQFVPTLKGRTDLFLDMKGPNNQKDYFNLSLTGQVVDF